MAHENKNLLRHRECLRVCCATLDQDVLLSNRITAIRVRANVPIEELRAYIDPDGEGYYDDMEKADMCNFVSLYHYIKLAHFYSVSLSTLFLNVDIKNQPRFV